MKSILSLMAISLGFIFNAHAEIDCRQFLTSRFFNHASYDRAETLKNSIAESATRIEPLLHWRGDIRIENLAAEMNTLSELANMIATSRENFLTHIHDKQTVDSSINLLSNSSNYAVQYESRRLELYSQIQILDLIFHNPSMYQKTFARKTVLEDADILKKWLFTIKENLKAELELLSTTSVYEEIQGRFN